MKNKITLWLAALIAVSAIGTTALADPFRTIEGPTGPSPITHTWNPTGNVTCTGDNTWHMRSFTSGFGFWDSTGSLTMRVYKAGVGPYAVTYNNVEFDGVTRLYNFTSVEVADKFTWTYSGLNSAGDAVMTAYCD